ncbi:hypothetical protein FVEN_g12750 [Fusarium venenatum]|uniref:Uncharacterized protein n=1 Tax=Fusarium venenatum TaxID=56646 RepID=A0A2L2TH23_9HYPO|nr:uncharacterized protein FVRRES_09376 [Fusarium venenatum]KAG8358172.1 hypothetical protein FVEN_g12750 [Fusarium venenatum]CEI69299.1 unnamed protein product [Fusarium venenatum]
MWLAGLPSLYATSYGTSSGSSFEDPYAYHAATFSTQVNWKKNWRNSGNVSTILDVKPTTQNFFSLRAEERATSLWDFWVRLTFASMSKSRARSG